MGDFVKVMSDGMGETVAAQPPLVASFTARQVPPTPTGISIRHLVIWRFREDTPQDALQGAVEGYQRLPEIMPEYFEHLTTSTHDGPPPDPGSCEHFRLSVRTVVLYSTFVSAHEQEGFVADERRKSFKANYVAPHLDSGGCLVFDFIPGAS